MPKFVFKSPSKYVQGPNVLENIGIEIKELGKKFLIVSDDTVWDLVGEELSEGLDSESLEFVVDTFTGEASVNEIDRFTEIGKDNDVDAVIGLGGGKAIDTAKGVADELKAATIIVPTIASTDAPTSALSVIYSDEGVFEGYRFYEKNPDLVLVDTQVIANAPAHLFAAGIADAMATFVEAKATVKVSADTMAGGKPTLTAQAIAEKAEETLFKYGVGAFESVKENLVTPQVEYVVEANTLLSGLGFENGGLAGAHAIHNGFTAVDGDIHDLTHGEKVAYGTLVQLVLEGACEDDLFKYIEFYQAIGMPTTLEEMHLDESSFEDLVAIGEVASDDDDTLSNIRPNITPEEVAYAILAVNEYTRKYNDSAKN